MIIFFINTIKKPIYIFSVIILLSFFLSKYSFASSNVFTVKELEVHGKMDLQFSRDIMIEKAFKIAFNNLLSQILASSDYQKIENVNLKEIKKLVKNFKIKKEIFRDNKYKASFDVSFDKGKIIKFLENKNLFYSETIKISALFFPIIVEGNKLFIFSENIFYKQWLVEQDKNDLINYIMPLDDIEELSNLAYSKDTIENLNMTDIAKKYNVENYILFLVNKDRKKLNFYSKIKFQENKKNLNLTFDNVNLENIDSVNKTIKESKIKFNDIWKNFNKVNTSIKLSINLTFKTNDSNEISQFEKTLKKIHDISFFSINKINLNQTIYSIIYNTNPNKLKNSFSNYGYSLIQEKGYWLVKNE